MHGIVHDFVVSQTLVNWETLPTGHGGGALIPTVLPIEKSQFTQRHYRSILDIGSLDINGTMKDYNFCGSGSNWTELVGCKEYTGIDLVAGRGVDQVMDAHKLDFKDNSFDLVLCLSVLEHDSDIEKTLSEGYRVLKPGGTFLIATVDETHPEHMEEHGVELPYNHLTEEQLLLMIEGFQFHNMWHFNSDLLVRIDK